MTRKGSRRDQQGLVTRPGRGGVVCGSDEGDGGDGSDEGYDKKNMRPSGRSCAKCRSDTPPIHALRNDTLYYCSECLIAATLKRARLELLSALSPRSLDLGCRLAVAVSSPRPDGSGGWCAWTLLKRYMTYHGREGLDVEAVHVRFEGAVDEADAVDVADVAPGESPAARVIALDGSVLATVEDPTGREDLRRVLVQHALARELGRGDLDCIVLGDTADALAARAVARAVKGQGHLLGDVGRPKDGFAFVVRDLGKDWVAACHRAFVAPGGGGEAVAPDGAISNADESKNKKNLNDLARSFAAQLLRSNPGGVSNILATAAKIEETVAEGDACRLCGEALADDEGSNRAGVCDACTTGVFGDWHDEVRVERTMALLPAEIRSRLVDGAAQR